MGVPNERATIKLMGKNAGNYDIGSIKLIGSNASLKWEQQNDALVIEPLKTYPSENAVVYKIELKKL